MCSLAHYQHVLKNSLKSVHNFPSYFANRRTDKHWLSHYLLGRGNAKQWRAYLLEFPKVFFFFILSTLLLLKFPLSGSLYQTEGTSCFGEVIAGQQWARGCKLKPTQHMRKDKLLVGVAAVPSIIPCKNFGWNTEKSLSDCDTDVLKNYHCSQTRRLESSQTDNFMD